MPLAQILALREAYRREMACQIVHDSWHARGFTRSYLLRVGGQVAGYGSVGGVPSEPGDVVKEFHLLPRFRESALPLFRRLVAARGARRIKAQTNAPLLLRMLLACAVAISAPKLLFADALATEHTSPGTIFRPLAGGEGDGVFAHTHEPVGEYVLEHAGEVVATGGLTFHYNPPFADLYMEVAAAHRRRGFGSYLVQRLKRVCREMGHVPAARCDDTNLASRRTLERAGMTPCGRIAEGGIA